MSLEQLSAGIKCKLKDSFEVMPDVQKCLLVDEHRREACLSAAYSYTEVDRERFWFKIRFRPAAWSEGRGVTCLFGIQAPMRKASDPSRHEHVIRREVRDHLMHL